MQLGSLRKPCGQLVFLRGRISIMAKWNENMAANQEFFCRIGFVIPAAFLATVLSTCTGCLPIAQQADSSDWTEEEVESKGSYSIELRSINGPPRRKIEQIRGDARVGEVLSRTKAPKAFSQSKVFVLRQVGENLTKMHVKYKRWANAVAPECDYAIYPGDRIIIEEDASNPLVDILGPVAGKLDFE
jgi:hypothetical protein